MKVVVVFLALSVALTGADVWTSDQMAARLETLRNEVNDLSATLNGALMPLVEEANANIAASLGDAIQRVSTSLGDVRSNRMSLEQRVAAIHGRAIGELGARAALETSVGNQLDSMQSHVETMMSTKQNEATELIQSLQDDVNEQLQGLDEAVNDEIGRSEGANAALLEALETAIEDFEASADELETRAGMQPPIIWSGGCRHHGHGGGWQTYCYNGNDRTDQFPSQLYADYIQVYNGNNFRFRQEGYYRLNWWAIQHGCASYNVRYESTWNGSHRHVGYAHRDSKPGGWFSNSMDQTWAFKEGDRFWMDVHGGWCNPYRWHSWNENGDHSRMQVTFVGPLA